MKRLPIVVGLMALACVGQTKTNTTNQAEVTRFVSQADIIARQKNVIEAQAKTIQQQAARIAYLEKALRNARQTVRIIPPPTVTPNQRVGAY